jgi:hypothetical protein
MTTINKETAFQNLFTEAYIAGQEAGTNLTPRPMSLVNADIRGNPIDNSPVYHVADGMCGYAWVVIHPATSSFAKWLLKNKLARTAYTGGGLHIWVSAHDQSVERKEAHASAMAKVFRDAGFRAYADSRLD